ncbi:MAG: hypothetical protein Tp118SUR00d2C21406351_23 [Prokaryotic dsDNA virus sp.]|nr:MAG: hypothetical protein Tp118SUR00d2C21406351_23 [Prokaryotic dsDNA virus sp.]|tara:strand:- start:16595 stop:17266 length:672 start_codon:yes stop_codon:yes gene_type:complete
MSLLNIFTPQSPTLGGLEFDAVLEDTFEASVEVTGYTVEIGARVSDHRIVKPFRWRIIGAISNNPFSAEGVLAGAAGGAISNVGGPLAAVGVDAVANYFAGSKEARASAALNYLTDLMTQGEPFDIDAGDIQLTDMIITDIRRTKDPENEGGLIFEAELQEYFTLTTALSANQPNDSQLNQDDPSASQASSTKNLGQSEPFVLTDDTYKLLQDDFPVFNGVDI